MKLILFLAIWIDDLALLIGMLFATDFTIYKQWVIIVVILDIISTIILGYYFKKDKARIIKVMKNVTLETSDGKFTIKGNKKEIKALLQGVDWTLKHIPSENIKLIIDKEKK